MGDIVSAVAVIGVLVLIIVWAQIVVSRRKLVLNSSSALGGLATLNSAFAPVLSSYPRVHLPTTASATTNWADRLLGAHALIDSMMPGTAV